MRTLTLAALSVLVGVTLILTLWMRRAPMFGNSFLTKSLAIVVCKLVVAGLITSARIATRSWALIAQTEKKKNIG